MIFTVFSVGEVRAATYIRPASPNNQSGPMLNLRTTVIATNPQINQMFKSIQDYNCVKIISVSKATISPI